MIIAEVLEEKINVLNSIFIAQVFPIFDEKLFPSIYEKFKVDHPKADHYPYAFIVDGYEKSSDDGEPANSAGRNLINLLKEKGFNKSGVIIARYFGGTKLGLPRLRKTFLDVSLKALENVKKGEIVYKNLFDVSLTYSQYDYLTKIKNKENLITEDTKFDIDVLVRLKTVKDKSKLIDILNVSEDKIKFIDQVMEVEAI